MNKDTRNAIESATQHARRLLEQDFAAQLEGDFDVHQNGALAAKAGAHLSARQAFQRGRVLAAIEHKRSAGMNAANSVADYQRDAAFTTLNRFVALKMLEARELVQECITKGEQSAGYREFCGMVPGLPLLPDSTGYRLYIESLFDELSTEVKVLFDRRDPSSVLWPKRSTFEQLLEMLNASELADVWKEDETIGWVYQYFNSLEERQAMKDVKSGGSQAPRNSRELATRNQFFTPRYIVRFLTDNTLGRLWWEMRGGDTRLRGRCEFLAIRPGAKPPERASKDPRDIRIIDPACGSGHFLLHVFDLLLFIYEEAWEDSDSPISEVTGSTLRSDFPSRDALHAALPELIIRHNLFGIDIDSRCVQVASFALWLRAQRAWSELRVPRAVRPRIERSHVVLAEPMPGDPELVREFASQVGHPLLGRLFEQIVDAFKLAGDLGIMLRVDRMLNDAMRDAERASCQGALFSPEATSRAFWETAEERLLDELARFAERERGRDSERRRLFRHDSAHGLALLDIARTRFDVVLMNPPFGDPSGPSKDYVDRAYPSSRQDIFAVFVDRCVRDLAPSGFIGVLSTEAGFFRRTLEPWRRDVLLAHSSVECFVHLGDNVLDTAKVRVAAYVLATPRGSENRPSTYVRAFGLNRASREHAVSEAVIAIRSGSRSQIVFSTPQSEFEKLPYAVFAYWCSPELRDVFVRNSQLEGQHGQARVGLQTSDDERFLRLRWEVSPTDVTPICWVPFAKGGEYSPFQDDVHLVLNWRDHGREILAWGKGRPQNLEFFGLGGLTWTPRTTKRFAMRVLPKGCAFANKGPAIFRSPNPWALLALLNSRVTGYLLSFGTGATETMDASNSYEVGLVQRLPVPLQLHNDAALAEHAKAAWLTRAERALRDETTALFLSPTAPVGLQQTLEETWVKVLNSDTRRRDEYVSAQEAIDQRTCALYGLTPGDWSEVEDNVGDVHRPDLQQDERGRRDWVERFISFLVGCAFGRFDPQRLRKSPEVTAAKAFDPPAAHQDESDSVPFLVDDAGHAADLAARCERSLETVIGDGAHRLIDEAAALLGASELRLYLRAAFFEAHLKQYTKSRRSAPIYLPLTTPGTEYTVWLYLHRVNADTLFTLQMEVLVPKLRLEEGRLAAKGRDSEGSGASARRASSQQQALVDALRAMLDEVKRVAPLWMPSVDDGVVVAFAPLWRLFAHHRVWQKELKATWDALCGEGYEWAHLAMHLWPERVIPKCATDRSLAIAHGLEEVFWVEGSDGKWAVRENPKRPIQELVRDRTSLAVKAALKSLLAAPLAAGNSGSGRSGRRSATADAD